MELADMIALQDVLVGHRAASKAELLRDLAQLAAGRTGIDETIILDLLIGRERLGSTGIGSGIAIPHANVPELGAQFTSLIRLVDEGHGALEISLLFSLASKRLPDDD